jgi:hypothetical protein
MEPTLRTDDLVITRKQAAYRLGDVVAFRASGGMVIHRIVGGNGNDGYDLKGDNNSWIDEWHPTGPEIVGKQWLRLPDKAGYLRWLRQPAHLAGLFGFVAATSLVKVGEQRRKSDRKRRTHMKAGDTYAYQTPPAGPAYAMPALIVAAALTVLFGLLAFAAFATDSARTHFASRATFAHNATYNYLVRAEPSTLYPDGLIGPVSPPPGEAPSAVVQGPPVYTRLMRSVDLGFSYEMKGEQARNVRGEVSAVLQILATGDNGWTKTLPLGAPQAFEGPQANTVLTLDLAPIRALIETIEKETGFSPNGYQLRVLPAVRVTGLVNEERVEEVFSSPFTINYNATSATFDSNLRRSEPRNIGESVTQPGRVDFGLVTLPVSAVRIAALTLMVVWAIATAAVAAVVFLGVGLEEPMRVRARYHTRLVPVTDAHLNGSNRVQVASLEHLAVLAARDGGVIFSQRSAAGDTYFVPDGTTTYEYTPQAPVVEA